MTILWLTLLIAAVSRLYAAVGQAGGSGYLATMALLGVSQAVMKPTALVLDVLVATVSTLRFSHTGYVSWAIFWPFAVTSVPAAFGGGAVPLALGIRRSWDAPAVVECCPDDRRVEVDLGAKGLMRGESAMGPSKPAFAPVTGQGGGSI
jgi:hypothetical protein